MENLDQTYKRLLSENKKEETCKGCGEKMNKCSCNTVEEELKGGQKKLDKNHNGKLDGQDFAILRNKKKKVVSETTEEPPFDKPYKTAKAVVTDKSGAKHGPMSRARDLARSSLNKHLNATYNEYNPEKDKLKKQHFGMAEEVEQIDELSRKTLSNYTAAASGEIGRTAHNFGLHTAKVAAMNDAARKAKKKIDYDTPEHKAGRALGKKWTKRLNGVEKATKRLAKEEFQLDEANHRDFASHGMMHPDMAKHMSVGQEHDYYEHGTGDKVSGKVMHKSDTEVHMKQTHDSYDPKKKGTVHKFKISDKLDESSVPFDRPYKKIKPVKNSDGTIQSPLSRARELAKAAANKTVKTEETISEEEGFTLHSKHTNPDGTVTIVMKSPNGKLVTHKGKGAHKAVKQRYGVQSEETELEEAKSNLVMCANCKGPLHKGACDDKSTWSKEMNKIKEQKEEGAEDKAEVTKHLNKIQSPHQVSILKKIQDMQKKRLEIVDNMPTAGGRSAEVNFREEAIQERLNMDKASMGDVIKDFEKSSAPQFAGKSAEKRRQMAIAAKLSKEEVSLLSLKSYLQNEETLDEIKMSDLPKRTVKCTSYGAQYHDPEGEDDADNKPAKAADNEKRGRGRPKGSASGARQKGSGSQTKTGGVDYTGYKLHLPNSNR